MLRIGHRGASGHYPENTLTAFKQAIALGADGVELDVHCSQDGALVVMHDDTVERTTDGHGSVAGLTLQGLRALSIAGGEKIPTLEEALNAIAHAYCFIEIKHADAALKTAELMEWHVKKGWPAGRLWLISFEHNALAQALRHYPALPIGASFSELSLADIDKAQALGARAIIPQHDAVTPEYIQKARAAGLQVICWTVNKEAEIKRLKALGVDGIISDYPERLGTSDEL